MIAVVITRRRLLLALLLMAGLLVPAAAAVGQTPTPPRPGDDTEVIGGHPTDPGEYPFQVGLLMRSEANRYQAQFCGGSLISPDTVLTAAHCVEDITAAELDILVGTHTLAQNGGGARVPARRIRVHPGYDTNAVANDVAIVQLGGQRPEATIRTIQAGQNALWAPGTTATVTGWGNRAIVGNDYPTVLFEVGIPLVSDTQCSARYPGEFIVGLMICAGDVVTGGLDSCQGDSGGPLFVPDGPDRVQIGVVSWGRGCGAAAFPGVYARLASYTAFINPYLDPDSAPDPVTALRGRRVSANAFRLSWRSPAFDGGTRITRFRVGVPSLGRVHLVAGNQTGFTLQGLPRGARRVVVQAVNAVGASTARTININL